MSPVFAHGRLRLYLLKLLDESPRHGYEVIRLLEDRFMGLYSPSAGTVYPRLQRLEAEGLVTHSEEGGRKVYQITDAGRAELRQRQEELDQLEAEIRDSVHEIASEIRDEVRGAVQDLKQELRQAAREVRRQQRHENRSRTDRPGAWGDWLGDWSGDRTEAGGSCDEGAWSKGRRAANKEFDRHVHDFVQRATQLAYRANVTEAQLRECLAIVDDALERIRATLRRPD